MTTYIGIDPGISGAVAALYPKRPPVVHDVPVALEGRRRRILVPALADLIRDLVTAEPGEVRAVLERVHSHPKQGVASTFAFGHAAGVLEGVVCALSLPYTLVRPQDWKKSMLAGSPKGKGAGLIRAAQLFPDLTGQLARKKDHNRADALLLAEYGRRNRL